MEFYCLQITVAYSMHTGCLEKAVKYTEKALAQVEKIRGIFMFKDSCLDVLSRF